MLYDVMWCDMMWCDMMRCDMIWYEDDLSEGDVRVMLSGLIWCDVIWCFVIRCDVMWCDVRSMWCDVIWGWFVVMWCDVMWCDARVMWGWCDMMWGWCDSTIIHAMISHEIRWYKYSCYVNDISRSRLIRFFCGTSIFVISMISHKISLWDISWHKWSMWNKWYSECSMCSTLLHSPIIPHYDHITPVIRVRKNKNFPDSKIFVANLFG